MSSVRVKVARTKLIEALKDRLALAETAVELNKKYEAEHKKAEAKYSEDLLKFAKTNKLEIHSVRTWWNKIEVAYSTDGIDQNLIPQQPYREYAEGTLQEYEIREIRNAIRLLNLSDEETVNTSTYKSVVGLL